MNLSISYLNIEEDKICKVSFSDLSLREIYSAINDYALSSIYKMLEAHIEGGD